MTADGSNASEIWGEAPPDGLPVPHPDAGKIRILFVLAWLVVGGEETELRLLARTLPRDRYRIDVIPCFRKEGMPEQTEQQLRALGIHVDTTPYALSFEDTVDYLRRRSAARMWWSAARTSPTSTPRSSSWPSGRR
jgi:polysaccharide biosynthesis protein PelF